MRTETQKKDNQNILLNRILISISLLLIVRIGTFVPVPGIEQEYLSNFVQNSAIGGFLNTFSSGGKFVIGLFTLNIFPYINSSILMQLLVSVFPNLQKLQKEEGNAGRRKITQITRYISFGFALTQSITIALFLKTILFNWNGILALQIVLSLTTGAMIVMWFSELITEYGIGNGASLLISTNIISNFPKFAKTLVQETDNNLSFSSILLIGTIFFIAICGITLLQEGARVIPLVSSKQLSQNEKNSYNILAGKNTNYVPLRLNQAGVMPIIFTTAILVIPNYLISIGFLPELNIPFSKYLYGLSYFTLILGFSYFYSKIVLDPKDISDQLRKLAVTVPGIRPGKCTTYYFSQILKRTTFIGAILLAIIAALPNIIETVLHISNLRGLGTTSLLILVGVTVETRREIRDVILSNIYTNMNNSLDK